MYTVGVFLCDRAYGGSEEGGWWYDYGIPVTCDLAVFNRTFKTRDEAGSYAFELQKMEKEWNKERIPVSSVNSDGEYRVLVQRGVRLRRFPKQRPRYE